MAELELCIPSPGDCGRENPEHPGHYCLDLLPHDWPNPEHFCAHFRWPRNAELELARTLYIQHWTTRYRDEIDAPPAGAVKAACLPTDSPWRELARTAARYLGVRL